MEYTELDRIFINRIFIAKMNLNLRMFIHEIIYQALRKEGDYVVNFDEHKSIKTHWVAFYVNGISVTYFGSFDVEHIPKEIRNFIGKKINQTNIFGVQVHDSVMCGHLWQWIY